MPVWAAPTTRRSGSAAVEPAQRACPAIGQYAARSYRVRPGGSGTPPTARAQPWLRHQVDRKAVAGAQRALDVGAHCRVPCPRSYCESGAFWGREITGEFPSLAVAPEEVRAFALFVDRVAAELRNGAIDLDNHIGHLVAGWSGVASDAYASSWQEVVSGASEIWASLFEFADALGAAGASYETVEGQSEQAIRMLNIPLA